MGWLQSRLREPRIADPQESLEGRQQEPERPAALRAARAPLHVPGSSCAPRGSEPLPGRPHSCRRREPPCGARRRSRRLWRAPRDGGGAAGAVPAAFEVAFHLVPCLAPVAVGGFGAVAVGGPVVLVGAGGVRVGAVAVGLPPVAVVVSVKWVVSLTPAMVGTCGLAGPASPGRRRSSRRRRAAHADEFVDAIEHAEPGGGAAVGLGVLGLVRGIGRTLLPEAGSFLRVHLILLCSGKSCKFKARRGKGAPQGASCFPVMP